MIDGLQIYHTPSPATLAKLDGMEWNFETSTRTRKPIGKSKRTIYNGLHFEQRKGANDTTFLTINGSIHKYRNNGLHNADRFTFDDLQDTLKSLHTATTINPNTSEIHGLEIGVNIALSMPLKDVLKQIVCYKNKPFNRFKTAENKTGLCCDLSDYKIKIYPKTVPSDTDSQTEVLRIELHVKKMRFIEASKIATLSDLSERAKMYSLKSYLITAIESIVFFDLGMNKKGLTQREHLLYWKLSNANFWQYSPKMERLRGKARLMELMGKHSHNFAKPILLNATLKEWETLFIPTRSGTENVTFSPLEYIGESVTPPKQTNIKQSNKNLPEKPKPNTVKRCCSCGRDISEQKEQSIFCGEKLYGKQARKCRNKASAKYRTFRNRIAKAKAQNLKVKIVAKTKPAILSPLELSFNGFLWRLVKSIELIPRPAPVQKRTPKKVHNTKQLKNEKQD